MGSLLRNVLGTILSYEKDPYVHCPWSSSKANADRLTVVHMSPPHSIDDEDKGDQASKDILAAATLYQTLNPKP